MKFRKKPIVVEAVRVEPGAVIPTDRHDDIFYDDDGVLTIRGTFGSDMKALHGDWIITCENGYRYPCPPDLFQKTYDPVEGEKPNE